MPIVPRANLPGETRPLSQNRLSANAPAEAFGVRNNIDIGGVVKAVSDIDQMQRERADQIATMDADAKTGQFETTLLYDPKTGLLNREGKNAFSAPEEAEAAWLTHTGEIEKGLATNAQRLAYRRMALQRKQGLDLAVQRHVSAEMKKYDDQTTKSYVEGEQNAALINFQDPTRITQSIARQKDAVRLFAQRNGLPQEWIDTQTADVASKTHRMVIEKLLSKDRDEDAQKYADSVSGEIVGADSIAVDKALDEGSTRGASQRQADQIVADTTSRREALDSAKTIKDAKVRDLVESRINHHYDEVREIQREEQDKLYLQSTNMLDAHPGTPPRMVIPPAIWSQLDLGMRNALERRANGDDDRLPNDDKRWISFLDMRPEDLAKLSQPEFESKYWAYFDKPHRERAAAQWAAARDAVKSGVTKNPQLAATLTFKDRVANTLRTSKLIPDKPLLKLSKEDRKTYMDVETEAARQIEEFELSQLGGKRRTTGEEMQQILDTMVRKRVFIDKNWLFADPEKVASLVTADEKGLAYVPIDRVPQADRNSIENILKSKGRRITVDIVQRAYAAMMLNDRAMFDSIIGGGVPTSAAPARGTMPTAAPFR